MDTTSLLVIGAGPYGLATAAYAIERGIDTTVIGKPMSFWTEHMPPGMYLRSGPDWHFDAAGVHTFEAYLAETGIAADEVDPVPLSVFLGYAAWFQEHSKVAVREELARAVTSRDGRFEVTLEGGGTIVADRVVAAPGPGPFQQLPDWADRVPPDQAGHTVDVVDFADLRGARVLVVGGRQSAYEWAALLADNGAERVDVVHRHPLPAFDRVSWAFVEPYMAATLAETGWWRHLNQAQRDSISHEFWSAGRLTLEWWLVPRLTACVHRWPETSIADVRANGSLHATLSNGEQLSVDRIIFATGYKPDIGKVPYLEPLAGQIDAADGFPVLDEALQSSVTGLYFPGFLSTRDFGPFFGFTRGCPAAAKLVVDDLVHTP